MPPDYDNDYVICLKCYYAADKFVICTIISYTTQTNIFSGFLNPARLPLHRNINTGNTNGKKAFD